MDLYIVGAVGLIVVGILAFLFYRYIGSVERAVTSLHAKLQGMEKRGELSSKLEERVEHQQENIQAAQEGGANLVSADVREENLIPPRDIREEPEQFAEEEEEGEDEDDIDANDAILAKEEEVNDGEDENDEEEVPALQELNGLSMTMGNELEQEEEVNAVEDENDAASEGILDLEEREVETSPVEITPETVRRMKVNEMREVAQQLNIEDAFTLKKVSLRNAILEKISQNNVKQEEQLEENEESAVLENDE